MFLEYSDVTSLLNCQISVYQASVYLTAAFKWVFEIQSSQVLKKKDLERESHLEVI